jgi:antitoxin HigA-1
MAEYAVRRPLKRQPTHPGALLREDVFPAMDVTVSGAAKSLGVSRQLLHKILAEKAPITPEMALRLGKFCGNGPDLWISMQTGYDLWRAERNLVQELRKIPTKRAA